PQTRDAPPHLIPIGRTIGIPANGAVSNLSVFPSAVTTLRRELAAGDFDFVGAALVGTFHTYGTNALTHGAARALGAGRRMNRLHGRIAVSQAAEWTAKRFFGGRYTVIPNGVSLPEELGEEHTAPRGRLHIAFVGQA